MKNNINQISIYNSTKFIEFIDFKIIKAYIYNFFQILLDKFNNQI